MITIHSQDGRHFLGLRMGRKGGYEIVYEDGHNGRRLLWELKSDNVNPSDVGQQLNAAIRKAEVLKALYAGLHSAEIEFEIYGG